MAKKYWVAASNSTWSNPNSWSNQPNGLGGILPPGEDDTAYFGSDLNSMCYIDCPLIVKRIEVYNFYGSIYMMDYDVRITDGLILQGYQSTYFYCSNKTLNIEGIFYVHSPFISTPSILNIKNCIFEVSDQSYFVHSNGTVKIDSSEIYVPDIFFCNVIFVGYNTIKASFSVLNCLELQSGIVTTANESMINLYGNLKGYPNYGSYSKENNAIIAFVGNSTQKIITEKGCIYPSFYINK